MDMSSLLAMLQANAGGGGAPNALAQQFMPRMPQFPGAGGAPGVQQVQNATSRALASAPQQQQNPISQALPPGAISGLASLFQPTGGAPSPISQGMSIPGVGGGSFNTMLNATPPQLSSAAGNGFASLLSMFGG